MKASMTGATTCGGAACILGCATGCILVCATTLSLGTSAASIIGGAAGAATEMAN